MRDEARQFKNDKRRMLKLNEALDRLSRYLDSGRKDALSSCDYKRLRRDPMPPSTHELDLWADDGAWRGFCHEEEGGRVVVDTIGEGLH